MCAFINTE